MALKNGEVPERSKGADCKSVGSAFEGSNPSLPTLRRWTYRSTPFFWSKKLEQWYSSQGLRFSCTQCSHCCRHEPGFVYLSQKDLTNLCQCFNLEEQQFVEKYCRWVPYYDGTEVLCLQEKVNNDCIFWDSGCTAYEARPVQCSTYPFWTFVLKSPETWIQEGRECPGINCGELRSYSEIENCKRRYEENEPVRKQEK